MLVVENGRHGPTGQVVTHYDRGRDANEARFHQKRVVNSVSHAGEASTSAASARLSRPVRISTPSESSNTPITAFPPWPAESIRSRPRTSASRDIIPISSKGSAAPRPNAPIVRVTLTRLSERAASTEAAPSVGPTHGLHTAPSRTPTKN